MLGTTSKALMRDQRGLSTVEYTVLLVLIVACSVGLWNKFGKNVKDRLEQANTAFDRKVMVAP